MEDSTYNGWANYPTWAVNLWLTNDQGLCEAMRERTECAIENAPEDDNVASGIWTIEETRRYRLADHLRAWVGDDLAPDLGASFAADLLGYALDQVDWTEIADSALDAWLEV